MKSANAESLKGLRQRLSLTLFTFTLFTSLILLSFLMVGTMLAQNESVSVQVGAEDRAAGTYGTSNFRYHILPARTLAGSAARSARTTKLSPRASASSPSSGGFFPADLTRGSGPLIKRAVFHDIDFDCTESCWGNPSAFLNDLGNSTFIHVVDRYVDISGFSPQVQVILSAMKKYGLIMADNGSSMYISGAPDSRWDNDTLHDLGQVPASAFEVVKMDTVYTASNVPQGAAPTINSFTATPGNVIAGGNVTLSWDVSNASYIVVSPQAGAVRGTSVVVQPGQTTTYKLYATNQYGRTTAAVTVTLP